MAKASSHSRLPPSPPAGTVGNRLASPRGPWRLGSDCPGHDRANQHFWALTWITGVIALPTGRTADQEQRSPVAVLSHARSSGTVASNADSNAVELWRTLANDRKLLIPPLNYQMNADEP